MSSRRTYGDRCGIARALDLVGERWALLVIRELLLGPKRFTDLRAGLSHVAPDVLSQRLRELEQADVVQRRKLPPPAASRVYELTARGRELEPVILALGRWGSQTPFPSEDAVFGPDSAILALKTLFSPTRAEGVDAGYELRLGEHTFLARVSEGRFDVRRGAPTGPNHADAVIATTPGTLAALLWHGRTLAAALESGEVELEGDAGAVNRFLKLFPAAEPAATAPTGEDRGRRVE